MSRYIDAIPFAQAVSDLRNKEREEYDNLAGKHRSLARSIHGQHVEFCEKMLKTIREQPTVDAVPVVHGEWIIKPHGTYGQLRAFCSACGKHSGIGGIVSNQKKPYCPNCGAIMDGRRSQ